MVEPVSIEQFLELAEQFPVADVRTPAEFDRGHLPSAWNLPLFSDEERVLVGTAYIQQGREQAILLGLEYVGPKMRSIIETVQNTIEGKTILLYCWRGGMRSSSVAWLLDFFGYKVYTLHGGYKTFRRFVVNAFETRWNIILVGGKTGSGKTHVLHALQNKGEQVVDLEALAHHKGSTFGRLGQLWAPTQEQFENNLVWLWRRFDHSHRIWIEDESVKIGWISIPHALWQQMCIAPIIALDVPIETRIPALVQEYGNFSHEDLAESITRIHKRLGGLETKQALHALAQGDLETVCRIALHYYDKTYTYSLLQRNPSTVYSLNIETQDADTIADTCLQYWQGIRVLDADDQDQQDSQ